MAKAVFKEVYEVTGSARTKADAFAADRKAAFSAQWDVVRALGANGYRPNHGGGIGSLLFDAVTEIPTGLRKTGREDGCNEYKPSLNTKAGKQIARQLAEAPRVKEWREFADEFGWNGRMPFSNEGGRGKIYNATGIRVSKPRIRYFVTFPRTLDDGWTAPEGLTLSRESEMLRAIEDHNAAVKTADAA